MQQIYQYTFLHVAIQINYSVVELPSNEKEADPEVPVVNTSSDTPEDQHPSDEGNDKENSVAQDQGGCMQK